MSDTSRATAEVKSGVQRKPVLQPWELAILPISRQNGKLFDLEHVSHSDFQSWVAWNGVPLEGEITWHFENRCAVVNHCIQEGLKLKIITALPSDLEIYWQLFEQPEPSDKPPLEAS